MHSPTYRLTRTLSPGSRNTSSVTLEIGAPEADAEIYYGNVNNQTLHVARSLPRPITLIGRVSADGYITGPLREVNDFLTHESTAANIRIAQQRDGEGAGRLDAYFDGHWCNRVPDGMVIAIRLNDNYSHQIAAVDLTGAWRHEIRQRIEIMVSRAHEVVRIYPSPRIDSPSPSIEQRFAELEAVLVSTH